MAAYTVYEPPDPPADRLDRAESLVFVRDGFSWGAALFGPLWFLLKGMWLVALGYVLLTFLIALGLTLAGYGGGTLNLVLLAVAVIAGFEASSLRHWTLDRRGWTFVGSVVGRNYTECERRFFEAWLPDEPVISAPQQPLPPPFPRRWGRLLGAKS